MIAALLVLGSATVASVQAANADAPYYIQKGSSKMVSYAMKYRKTDVPEAQASSAVVEIVDSLLAPAQATDLVRSAVNYYLANGPTVSGAKAEELASRASSYYDKVATAPAYKSFAALVAESTPLFDINRAAADAQNLAAKAGSKQPVLANKAIVKASGVYSSLKADAAGVAAIETGKSLARKVAEDFSVNRQAVKSKVAQIKDRFVQAIFAGN